MTPIAEPVPATLIIDLTYRQSDLEAIYYHGANQYFWRYPPIRGPLFALALLALLGGGCYWMAIRDNGIGWILGVVFAALLFCVVIVQAARKCYEYFGWRQKVNVFIHELVKQKTHRLTVTPEYLILETPLEKTIDQWSNLTELRLYPTYLLLFSGAPKYTFIKAAMQAAQFAQLSAYLSAVLTKTPVEGLRVGSDLAEEK